MSWRNIWVTTRPVYIHYPVVHSFPMKDSSTRLGVMSVFTRSVSVTLRSGRCVCVCVHPGSHRVRWAGFSASFLLCPRSRALPGLFWQACWCIVTIYKYSLFTRRHKCRQALSWWARVTKHKGGALRAWIFIERVSDCQLIHHVWVLTWFLINVISCFLFIITVCVCVGARVCICVWDRVTLTALAVPELPL